QFYVNGTATGPQMPVGGFGNSAVASYSTSTLPSGTDAITALFTEGNGYVESSGSAPLNQVVNSTTENGSFTLTPSTPALTITQGASGSDVITVTDLGGFSGSVDLSVSGLPSGVGAGFSPGPSTGTSELTLTANSTAATGTFTVTITGTSGALTASTTIALTVDVPASFSIAPQAAALSITQGGTGTDTIAVNDAGGFSGSVTLAASGLPVGVTASFDTNPATGNSVLTLAANSAAATGTSTITITGTSGALTASTSISLTVNAPASFTIAAQAAALSITQGGAGTDTIAVDGAGGFSGSVTLAASGLPTGVTASFGINPATGTSVLTLAANSAAATGVYSLTVTGTSTSTTESASTTIQFAVDSAGASTPSLGVSAATVAAGSSATYPVTLPSNVTSASVACMNLPAGATCSFSSTTNAVTIATSSTTPSGIYQVTVVFTETVTAAASAGLLLPIGLLPLLLLRRRLALRGIWTAACLGLILLAATALSTGCGGAGSTQHPPPSTYQMTSSATVSLTVQ
ncbi:MAG TPA: hypothetical protein VL986_09095, partial [Terracidiphilus sp.]|nr:hypothetical protein [Terracidiphilus sp.]